MPLRDLLIALAVIFVWGLNAIVMKIGVTEIPALEITTLRFLLVAVLLLPWMRINRQQFVWLLVLSFTFGFMYFGLLFFGLSMSEAGTASLLSQLGTPFATILAAVFLHERLNSKIILGLVISFAGVLVLAGGPSLPATFPLTLLLLSALGWAISNLLIKMAPSIPSLTMAGWISLLAIPQMALASWIFESHQWQHILDAGWRGWGSILYSAICSSILAYSIWYSLLRRYVMARLIPLTLLSPVFAVILGIIILGDSMNIFKITGGLMVIGGIALVNMHWKALWRYARSIHWHHHATQTSHPTLTNDKTENKQ